MTTKIGRTLGSVLPVSKNRTGACNQCGDCCKLPTPCVFLKGDEEQGYQCGIYKMRPLVCRKFPRTKAEWEDVKTRCGYRFEERQYTTPQRSTIETNFKTDGKI